MAEVVRVFHADSLAGPMRELKKAFEAKNKDVTIDLTTGVSKQLAERILKGETCDVFASSSPAVIDAMFAQQVAASKPAASWYVVFSANEMVVIVEKGNPLGIQRLADLAKPGVRFIRVTGKADLATGRTIEFLNRAASREGNPDLAATIINASPEDPAKPRPVPETVRAVAQRQANAGVVYYSAAVAARDEVDIIRFPREVNLSEAIQNAATVPGTAKSLNQATRFIQFLISAEGQTILLATGQPPVVPAVRKGQVPAGINA